MQVGQGGVLSMRPPKVNPLQGQRLISRVTLSKTSIAAADCDALMGQLRVGGRVDVCAGGRGLQARALIAT